MKYCRFPSLFLSSSPSPSFRTIRSSRGGCILHGFLSRTRAIHLAVIIAHVPSSISYVEHILRDAYKHKDFIFIHEAISLGWATFQVLSVNAVSDVCVFFNTRWISRGIYKLSSFRWFLIETSDLAPKGRTSTSCWYQRYFRLHVSSFSSINI